jgi:hypothetical protein
VPQLMANYVDTNRIRYVYREVYFDRFGLWASMVARCGGADRFFGIVDMIYEQQPEWTQGAPRDIAENLRRIGRTAGLTNDELDACLTNQPMAEALLAAYEANTAVHEISGTPTLVINDVMHSQHELRGPVRPSGRSARRGRMTAPLAGLRVLELARILAGPWAGQTLADLGAEVIKVEAPEGDDTRRWGPPFVEREGDTSAAYFHSCNRGKRSVTADFRTEEGRARVLDLARDADVLIENFKLGGLAKYGLDYDNLRRSTPG